MAFGKFRRRPLFAPAAILAIGLVAFPGFTVLYVTQSQAYLHEQVIRDSAVTRAADDHRWCATLEILVSSPRLAPGLRGELTSLKKEFSCS